MNLPHRLDRTVVIHASRETVFRYFTDSSRWAAWWGPGSTIDPRSGGKLYIRHPNGIEVGGEVLEVMSPDHIVFTYGYTSGKPMPPGASRVTIRLEEDAEGTRLRLTHEFAEASARDEHIQGWRFQLSVFSNVATNEAFSGSEQLVDAWFAVWAEADESKRRATLATIAVPGIAFHDRFSTLDGADDLTAHIGAALRFMPGIRLQRDGAIRHCQGTVLANWVALGNDGLARASGTSVFTLEPGGRIRAATSFSNPPAA